jgi:hypothetical protein
VVIITPFASVVSIRSGPSLGIQRADLLIRLSILKLHEHIEEAANVSAVQMIQIELRLVLAGLQTPLSIEW